MVNVIHFYAAASRLGLKHKPMGSNDANVGVEHGGQAILTPEFLGAFPAPPLVTTLLFSNPEEIADSDYYQVLASEYRKAADVLSHNWDNSQTVVLLGGDHSVGVISLLALLDHFSATDIGHIQIDSHTDINTKSSSPTGNFHGMWLRPFIGDFDIPVIKNQILSPIPPKNVMYIGNLDCDPEEKRFIAEKEITTINQQQLKKTPIPPEVEELIRRVTHLHISVDIDGFDGTIAPATGIPAQQGLLWEEIEDLLTLFSYQSSLSIDLVNITRRKKVQITPAQ